MKKIMNIQDKYFNNLIKIIKNNNEEQLFIKIKNNYLNLPENIKSILENYFDKYPFWGTLHSQKEDFDEIMQKTKILKKHYKDFIWLYNKLEDYNSKFVLISILANWINYDFDLLKKSINYKYRQYFDFDILPACQDETYVDVGCYQGETTLDFINCYGKNCYKKIYCYEITKELIPIIENNFNNLKNIELKNCAVGNKNSYIYLNENLTSNSANKTSNQGKYKIKCVKIDNDIKDKISLIKMDIEGDEVKAIQGCKNHIKNYAPKLMISIYHNNSHYFKIPKLINEYNKNYKFYLRNYGGNLYPTEIILIAMPK